jgi:hypothetical protein
VSAVDVEFGQQRRTVGGVPWDGAGTVDGAAAGVSAAVIDDLAVVVERWVGGDRSELVRHQRGLDEHHRFTRTPVENFESDIVDSDVPGVHDDTAMTQEQPTTHVVPTPGGPAVTRARMSSRLPMATSIHQVAPAR